MFSFSGKLVKQVEILHLLIQSDQKRKTVNIHLEDLKACG